MPLIYPVGFFGSAARPPSSSLWAWWYANGGAYTETSGTPTTLISVDGTAIGSLFDQSGNGRHIYQATGGNKPTYKTSQVNTLAAALFARTSSQRLATNSVMPSPTTPLSGYFIAYASTWTDISPILATDSATPVYLLSQRTSSPNIALYNNGAGSTTAMSLTTWHLVSGIINGSTSSDLRVDNGTSVTGALTGGGGGASMQLGGNTGNSLYWDGYIAEVLLYTANHDPASGDGLLARRYLNSKYALGLGI